MGRVVMVGGRLKVFYFDSLKKFFMWIRSSSTTEKPPNKTVRRCMVRLICTFQCRDFHQDECTAPNCTCGCSRSEYYMLMVMFARLSETKYLNVAQSEKFMCDFLCWIIKLFTNVGMKLHMRIYVCVCIGSTKLLGHIKVPITVNSAEFSIYCETQSLNFAMNAISDQRNVE